MKLHSELSQAARYFNLSSLKEWYHKERFNGSETILIIWHRQETSGNGLAYYKSFTQQMVWFSRSVTTSIHNQLYTTIQQIKDKLQ